jgi:hypothetical protein
VAWCVCAAPPPGSFSHVTLRVTNGERDAGAGRRLSPKVVAHVVAKGMYSSKGCRFFFTLAG